MKGFMEQVIDEPATRLLTLLERHCFNTSKGERCRPIRTGPRS